MKDVRVIKNMLRPVFSVPEDVEIRGFIIIAITDEKISIKHNASNAATLLDAFDHARDIAVKRALEL